MPHDHRAPGAHKIEQARFRPRRRGVARCRAHDQRLSTDGPERTDGTVHAANQHLLGALEISRERLRSRFTRDCAVLMFSRLISTPSASVRHPWHGR